VEHAAIIVAAGRGVRAGGDLPKQYQLLGGTPVLVWSIRALALHPGIGQTIVVIGTDDQAVFDDLVAPHVGDVNMTCVIGGATRSDSVHCGLQALAGRKIDAVLIHDGARPLVGAETISAVTDALKTHDGAAPGLAVSDTLWHGDDGGQATGIQPRDGLYRAQTPQGFRFDAFVKAHTAHAEHATDDVQVALNAGLSVHITPGSARNIKLTQPEDFARAAQLLGQHMDIRTGQGFDVHRFTHGSQVILCGVPVAHSAALSGHSDADVAMHALTDAIYGALAAGDIGRHFPPSDDQWKNAASSIFLKHAVELARARRYRITNMDITIICEHPKITPHAGAMCTSLATITGVAPDRISVKATTSERLGFAGRGEGIAAMALATLARP